MMEQNWLLPTLIAIPFVAGFLCWLIEKVNDKLPRWIALFAMLATFGVSLVLWQQGDFGSLIVTNDAAEDGALPWAAEFIVPWIESLGINFHLAMDGLSLLMIALTAFWVLWRSAVRGARLRAEWDFFILTYYGHWAVSSVSFWRLICSFSFSFGNSCYCRFTF